MESSSESMWCVVKLHPDATMPVRLSDGKYNLFSMLNVKVWPNSAALIHTGIAIHMPKGFRCITRPEIDQLDTTVAGGEVVYNNCMEEIYFRIYNDSCFVLNIKIGDPVAKMVVESPLSYITVCSTQKEWDEMMDSEKNT